MNEYMNNLLSRQKIMGNSDALNKIVNNIKKNKSMTKREVMSKLDWGRGIKWTPYRRALMNHPNIYDVIDYEPSYIGEIDEILLPYNTNLRRVDNQIAYNNLPDDIKEKNVILVVQEQERELFKIDCEYLVVVAIITL